MVEGMPQGQAVEVTLVGRWGQKERVNQGSSIPVTALFLPGSSRNPSSWAVKAQSLSQYYTSKLKQSQD